MGVIKEPKDVDFIINSEPWTDKDLEDFRKLMQEQKRKTVPGKIRIRGKGELNVVSEPKAPYLPTGRQAGKKK